jgi:hypothetical protein
VRGIVQSVGKFIGGSTALGAVAYFIIRWPGFYGGTTGQKVLALGVAIAAAATTYFAVATLLRSRELAELRLVSKARGDLNAGL